MLSENLAQHPHEVAYFPDDVLARQLLLELGVLPAFEAQNRRSNTAAQLYSLHDHPTHWLLIRHFQGFAAAEDNGWAIEALPKSDYTPIKFDEAFASAARQLDSPHTLQVPKTKPEKN